MTPDDLTSPVHFAPYGGTNAICGETVPRSVGVFPDTGEYDDARFTVRRGKATCRECLCRTRRTASPDDLTSRAQVEARRRLDHMFDNVGPEQRHPDPCLPEGEGRSYIFGFGQGATWAAAQAPSVEALTADYNRGWHDAMKAAHESVGTYLGYPSANGVLGFGPDAVIVDGDWLKVQLDERDALTAARISPDAVRLADAALALATTSVLSQDDATALLRTAQSALTFMATSENAEAERDTLTARLDRMQAGIKGLDQDTHLFARLERLCIDGVSNPSTLADALQDEMTRTLRALLAEDET